MLYDPKTAVVNATAVGTRTVIDAHALPHLKISKTERALLGADIISGITLLTNPTLKQVAESVGVSPATFWLPVASCPWSAQQWNVASAARPAARH